MIAPEQANARPSSVQMVTLAAACAWIATYTAYAIAFHEDNRRPWLMAVVLVLALTADAVALAPLFTHKKPHLDRGLAVLLAVTAIVVAAGVVPFLAPQGLSGYANWPIGGMCVLIAALAMRHRGGAAALAVLGLTTVNTVSVWRASSEDPAIVGAPSGTFLAVLPFTWWLAALAVRLMLDRSQAMVEEYRRRQVGLAAEALLSGAVRESEDQRRLDLRAQVLPLLERLAQGSGPVDSASRAEATRVATSLRDDLRARSLLTRSLRELVASARDRGVWVSLSCDPGLTSESAHELVTLARVALTGVLPALGQSATLTCRVTSCPPAALLVVNGVGAETVAELADALRATATGIPGAALTLDDLDQELVAHLALAEGVVEC